MSDESGSAGGKLTRGELLKRGAVGTAALGMLGLAACGGGSGGGSSSGSPAMKASTGGTLRIGVPGGSSKTILDGQNSVTKAETARLVSTWEGVSFLDQTFQPQNALAQEITAEAADKWVIRLRDGVEFHNGKTLTADDLIYSLRRTLDPDLGMSGRALLSAIDPNGMKKLDARTVRLNLKRPDATLLDGLSQYFQGTVPVGYSPKGKGEGPLKWVGTSMYKIESFEPGRQSVHVPFGNYWRDEKPNFDRVILLDIPDDTARTNALLSDQIDVAIDVPLGQIPIIKGRKSLKLYDVATGAWNPFTMRVDIEPFKDVRVRKAMKLLADREQIIAQALSGFGKVANDLHSPFDSAYIGDDIEQRKYDPEQAKSLLSAAGRSDLRVEFVTSTFDTGAVEQAQAYAQSAKAGGVTVKVRNVDSGTLYGDNYLKWPFSGDLWSTRNYLAQVSYDSLPTAPYNAMHFDNPKYNKLYEEALATVDDSKRNEIAAEMQRIEYDEGGNVIPVFKHFTDAYSAKITGLVEDGGAVNFNRYGNGFRTISFTG
jgi:peptide/nickel transport system substrate-binding protein